jgi:hypothetical protein
MQNRKEKCMQIISWRENEKPYSGIKKPGSSIIWCTGTCKSL